MSDMRTLELRILSLRADLATLEADFAAVEKRSAMHADINRRSAAALGKPPDGEGSRWGDIPECIAAKERECEGLRDNLFDCSQDLGSLSHVTADLRSQLAAMTEAKEEVEKVSEGWHQDCDRYQNQLSAMAQRAEKAELATPSSRASEASDEHIRKMD